MDGSKYILGSDGATGLVVFVGDSLTTGTGSIAGNEYPTVFSTVQTKCPYINNGHLESRYAF